jgi:hypothetical protein
MTETVPVGTSTGGKPINLSQLQGELVAAGVNVGNGLGVTAERVHAYDALGQAADLPAEQQAMVHRVVAAHIAMRDKSGEEYATEFQNPATTVERKQEIRDIINGLLPRERVPMT